MDKLDIIFQQKDKTSVSDIVTYISVGFTCLFGLGIIATFLGVF